MKALIEKELSKFKDSKNYDGLNDSQYSKLEKMIFNDIVQKQRARYLLKVLSEIRNYCILNSIIIIQNLWQASADGCPCRNRRQKPQQKKTSYSW